MRLLLLIIGLILLSNSFFGQSYAPLLRADVEWWVIEAFEQTPTWTYKYKINGNDTLFNGHTYRPLNSMYLREDTLAGKVYKVNFSDSNEVVLYDFTLEVGDSALSKVVGDSTWVYVVQVNTVKIGSEWRKKITFNAPDASPNCIDSWIEGVGSIFGPLGPPNFGYDCWHYRAYLSCYKDTSKTLYGDCTPVGVEKIDGSSEALKIWPNPTSGKVNIISQSTTQEVEVIDWLGRRRSLPSTSRELDLSNFPQGVYVVRVRTENGWQTHKLVLQ